jgi:hypothetical protein
MLWMTLEEAVLMNEQALGEARSRGVTDLVNIPGIVSLRVMDTMMLLSAAFDPEPSA